MHVIACRFRATHRHIDTRPERLTSRADFSSTDAAVGTFHVLLRQLADGAWCPALSWMPCRFHATVMSRGYPSAHREDSKNESLCCPAGGTAAANNSYAERFVLADHTE